jgi:hypothetical protein
MQLLKCCIRPAELGMRATEVEGAEEKLEATLEPRGKT